MDFTVFSLILLKIKQKDTEIHKHYVPISPIYQSINLSPHNAAVKIPTERYGPIANFALFFVTAMIIHWIREPTTQPITSASIIFCQPRQSPAAAISLISPPPIPLPLVKIRQKNRKRLAEKKPIT